MKKIIPYFFLILCGSCQFFNKKAPSKEELLEKELKKVRWDKIDEFPSGFSCDTIFNRKSREACFFEKLAENIQNRLELDTLQLLYPEIDTLQIKVTIFPDSKVLFETHKLSKDSRYDLAKLDSMIQSKLVDFPALYPGIKRGIKVKTQLVVPVIVNIAE